MFHMIPSFLDYSADDGVRKTSCNSCDVRKGGCRRELMIEVYCYIALEDRTLKLWHCQSFITYWDAQYLPSGLVFVEFFWCFVLFLSFYEFLVYCFFSSNRWVELGWWDDLKEILMKSWLSSLKLPESRWWRIR